MTSPTFDSPPSDADLLEFVEEWIDLLAAGKFDEAFALTKHDPYFAWTPDLMRRVVAGYGTPEPRHDGLVYQVTERCVAAEKPLDRAVDRKELPPGQLAEVRHSLPLNGEWSDLTVTFGVFARNGGVDVVLQEIHVF